MWFQNLFKLLISVRVGAVSFAMMFAGLPEYCSSLKRRKLLYSEQLFFFFFVLIIPTRGLAYWGLESKSVTFFTMQGVIMEKVMFDLMEIKIRTLSIFKFSMHLFNIATFAKCTKL